MHKWLLYKTSLMPQLHWRLAGALRHPSSHVRSVHCQLLIHSMTLVAPRNDDYVFQRNFLATSRWAHPYLLLVLVRIGIGNKSMRLCLTEVDVFSNRLLTKLIMNFLDSTINITYGKTLSGFSCILVFLHWNRMHGSRMWRLEVGK